MRWETCRPERLSHWLHRKTYPQDSHSEWYRKWGKTIQGCDKLGEFELLVNPEFIFFRNSFAPQPAARGPRRLTGLRSVPDMPALPGVAKSTVEQ